MAHRILVIDPDTAFATLLKEALEHTGQYEVCTIGDGSDPLGVLASSNFAMVILDMGLSHPPAPQVAQAVRGQHPELPLVIIPFDGDTPPAEISALGIQGVLTKPFFLPDLPGLIARALGISLPSVPVEPTPASTAPAPAAAPIRAARAPSQAARATDVNEALTALARELDAEAVMLTHGNELVAHAGRLERPAAEQLARVILESWQASTRVAQLLGREKVRFEQSMHEGDDYMLYSLSVSEDTILSIALRASTPLGMIRYHTKQAAQAITRLVAG